MRHGRGTRHRQEDTQKSVRAGPRARRIRNSRILWNFTVQQCAWRNRVAVRAGFGMAQERADALVQLGADDVFELAGLVVGLGVIDGESVFEEALGQAVAADDVARAAGAGVGELRRGRLKDCTSCSSDMRPEHARGDSSVISGRLPAGPVACRASTLAGFPSSPKIQICSRR